MTVIAFMQLFFDQNRKSRTFGGLEIDEIGQRFGSFAFCKIFRQNSVKNIGFHEILDQDKVLI